MQRWVVIALLFVGAHVGASYLIPTLTGFLGWTKILRIVLVAGLRWVALNPGVATR